MLDKDVIHYLKHIKAHERLKQLIPSSGTSIATMTSQEIADYIIKNTRTILSRIEVLPVPGQAWIVGRVFDIFPADYQ